MGYTRYEATDTITTYYGLPITDDPTKNGWITLYEFGEQLTNCDCNFENLFRNWTPQFISNSENIPLLSYHFVETVNDSDRINYYYDILTNLDVLVGRHGERNLYSKKELMETEEKVRVIEPYFRKESYANSPVFKSIPEHEKAEFWKKVKQEIETMSKIARFSIKSGDQIYVVKFKFEGKIYDNYVVCDPEKKRITWDNIFNVPFNKENIKLYD